MDWINAKKNIFKLCISVMLLLVLGSLGCSRKKESKKFSEEGFCTNASVFDCLYGQSFCDKGMLQIENGLMIFHEYETGKSYPLCSDAYCEHQAYSHSKNPDPVCEATMKNLKVACIYGDYVYMIQDDGWKLTVSVRNLKESGYRVLTELPYCLAFSPAGYNAIIEDKAYLLLGDTDKEFGDEPLQTITSNDLFTYLVELDLKTGEYKTLLQFDKEKKYKILQTVYDVDGVYCRCYYEDIEMKEDFTGFTVNEYREVFYYVPYDGSEVKELCPEVAEITAFGGEIPASVMVSGISDKGVYLPNAEQTKLQCYYYNGKKETVYELPEDYDRFSVNGICGTSLVMILVTPEKKYQTVVMDLKTKKVSPLACRRIVEEAEYLSYKGICDGAFQVTYGVGSESKMEVWLSEALLSEDGQPLISLEKQSEDEQPLLSVE